MIKRRQPLGEQGFVVTQVITIFEIEVFLSKAVAFIAEHVFGEHTINNLEERGRRNLTLTEPRNIVRKIRAEFTTD